MKLVQAFSFPTRLGHDVFLYDQIGGGLSGRLDDVSEYTLERHVSDLEAIRQRIEAETVVLMGESWGAKLATHYLVAHALRGSTGSYSCLPARYIPRTGETEIRAT